jgi:hypothetical protein
MILRRKAELRQDTEEGVLCLTGGRQELALSATGLRARTGGRTADLPWGDVEQVQLGDLRGVRACVEVFTVAGPIYSIGPFPAPLAERWVRACTEVAARADVATHPLKDGVGMAITHDPPAGT